MEYNPIEIQEIKQKLIQGQTLEDLAALVNHVISLQNTKEGTQYKPITVKRLKYYYANINKKYTHFEIPKKTGGIRTITAPDKFLKKVQRRLNLIFSLLFEAKPAAHGFIEKRSIVTNAQNHIGKKYVLNIDLKDFFPTIHFGRVMAVLQIKPFGLSPEFAKIIANFCCFESKLPQGAPTSPVITNIICQRLDYKLVKLAEQYHCFYSRYADDLTFSSNKNIFNDELANVLNGNLITGVLLRRKTIIKNDKVFFLNHIKLSTEETEISVFGKDDLLETNRVVLLEKNEKYRPDGFIIKSKKEGSIFEKTAVEINAARNKDFLIQANKIIKEEGFGINNKKLRINHKSTKQQVTGITVNEKLNLSREYVRRVRATLNNWEKHGYENASAKFASYYRQEKGFMRNKSIPPMESVLSGKILFLGMVRGKEDTLFLKYQNQLKELIKKG